MKVPEVIESFKASSRKCGGSMFAVVRSSSLVAALPKVWLNVYGGRPVSPECVHPAPRTTLLCNVLLRWPTEFTFDQ